LGKLFTICASVTKQYNLVPANGQWCSAAGKEPQAWRKVMAAWWMTYSHLWADCLYTGIGSGPNAR